MKSEADSSVSRPARRLTIAVLAALVLAVAIVASMPFLVATDAVSDAFRRELSAATGHQVEFSGRAELGFLPVPRIVLEDLQIVSERGGSPLLSAERIEADFSLVGAVTGNPRFSRYELKSPVFNFQVFANGGTNWRTDHGRIAETKAVAGENARARAAISEGAPEVSPLPDPPFESLTIVDGTISVTDRSRDVEHSLTAVNGRMNWPGNNMPSRLDLSAIFRGEPVRLLLASERPSDLMGGAASPLRLSLTSELLEVDFSGSVVLGERPLADGQFALSSPSLRRVLQWSGTQVKPGEAIGVVDLDAHMQADSSVLRFSEVALNIDENRGVGALDIAWSEEPRPRIAGTLAYDQLNIGDFLEAFSPLPKDTAEMPGVIDTGFLRQLALDLRLSAKTARLGPLAMTNVAASTRIEEGRAHFDIGDATAYGGTVVSRIEISEVGFDGGGNLRLSASNVDFASILSDVGAKGTLPRGTGDLELNVSSQNPLWATSLRDLSGEIDLVIGPGTIAPFDLARFKELAANQRFFGLDSAQEGALDFQRVSFHARFANGTAEVDTATLLTSSEALHLSGIIPYARGSLALTGTLGPSPLSAPTPDAILENDSQAAAPAVPELRFFVGGSWPSPVISPVRRE